VAREEGDVKLHVGMRVVDRGGSRWQIVAFGNGEVAMRPMRYVAGEDGKMGWVCPPEYDSERPVTWLRGNFNVVFTADKEQP
jgi:hypothetical protein